MPSNIQLFNRDCMEAMKEMPDKAFDLAIVDPPYGINFGKFNRTNKAEQGKRIKANKYKNGEWDKEVPKDEYFDELIRVSKNQIVWGGNYYNLGASRGFIFWYKNNPVPNFSDGEFAWTSFNCVARCFNFPYYGNINSDIVRIHPTQKPIKLYQWILRNYAPPKPKFWIRIWARDP